MDMSAFKSDLNSCPFIQSFVCIVVSFLFKECWDSIWVPGGLVVRIRRSHRRGPGSIPGQGTLCLENVQQELHRTFVDCVAH